MLLKKVKFLIYIILFVFALNFILTVCSFAIDEDSIYVWSNSSSSFSTATTPVQEKSQTTTQDTSRKLFRYYFWWCYINGPKNWKYIV